MPKLAMLVDLTRCIGCDACTVACKQENGTPADVFFARVLNVEAGRYPDTKRVYLPMLCYHCENPACLKACPNKAIFKRQDGVVLIDQDRCKGTGACVSSCPYGNIVLRPEDHWYLNSEPYEEKFVKPRLRQNVARKCTYCVHRVDEGLDPACVVACPTKARIFGDLEDEASEISTYIAGQSELTGRNPFPLLPEAGTKPTGSYLGTMAEQGSSSLGGRAGLERAEPLEGTKGPMDRGPEENRDRGSEDQRDKGKELVHAFWKRARKTVFPIGILALVLSLAAFARSQDPQSKNAEYAKAGCADCHGEEGMGADAPPVSQTKLSAAELLELIRKGKGDMPPATAEEISDERAVKLHEELKTMPWLESKIPSKYLYGRNPNELYSTTNCMGCHGLSAMGGLGPPIAKTKKTPQEFMELVRKGKGMMTATKPADLSDEQIRQIYDELQAKPWDETQIPIAFKVGQLLATKNVAIIFTVVTLFALIFGTKVWIYWIKLAAPKQLWPAMKKFGLAKALGIAFWSFLVDGFLVASLWRRSKARWAMHGLILYGFVGLMAADALMQIFNPTRAELPLFNPLKLLPIVAGVACLSGVLYVMLRYKKDEYIDNGLTQGRDFLFLNLLFHTLLAGFLTVVMKRAGIHQWVMPVYLYHLAAVLTLIVTAPFTRFMHVWIVPTMVALTRLTDEIVKSGIELGFEREPAPGRHHKSQRIAESLIQTLAPGFEGQVKLRYYP